MENKEQLVVLVNKCFSYNLLYLLNFCVFQLLKGFYYSPFIY